MTDYTTLSVTPESKNTFEEAKKAVQAELGDSVTQSDVIRELSEAYIGRDGCGRWKHE